MPRVCFDQLTAAKPLVVYIDYKSPYAYLAKDPTYAIADRLGIEIDWRPFTLDIPSYLGSARLDGSGRVVESRRTESQWGMVRYGYYDARRYGKLRGLVVRGTTKIWDSSVAAIGMLWAKEQGEAVLRSYSGSVYERFWKRELDIEDVAVIEDVLRQAGARTVGFRAWVAGEGRILHDDMQRKFFEAGIFGVPTYAVGDEVFFGREHLPRVRWMLTGRRGAPPDVAYDNFSDAAAIAASGEAGGAALSVAIDFKSPYAYLAIAPTCATAAELGLNIDWLPFLVPAWKTFPSSRPDDDRGTRHRLFRAEYQERDVIRYAADRGLEIRDLKRDTDSTVAALGLLWIRHRRPSLAQTYVQRVFDGYWRENMDIQDERVIRGLLSGINVPVSGFEAFLKGEGRTELERVRSELLEAGIRKVPAYRLDDNIFLGRQHLPLIRHLCSR